MVIDNHLAQLRVLTDTVPGGVAFWDLSYKLKNALYQCDDGLKNAYDIARDIAYIGKIIHADDIATIADRVAKIIFDYALECDPWDSDD